MCFGIPMQVRAVDGYLARCAAKGSEREVDLFLLADEPVAVGDHLVVHLGRAIQKVSAEEAAAAWEVYDAMLAGQEDMTREPG